MAAPKLVKNWTITPNLRRTFVSLNDAAAWCMYQNKAAMVARGWTVKFSSDGVTGPSSGADTTDRWASQANCTVRGATAAAPQSWIVLQNVDGVHVKITYVGATDDIFGVAYSPGGLYVIAATPTHSPTATDEVVISNGNTMVNATTSNDRVMSIWCRNDTRAWSFALFRQSALISHIGVEEINSHCATGVFTVPYVGYRSPGLNRLSPVIGSADSMSNLNSTIAIGSATWQGIAARVTTAGSDRNIRAAGGIIFTCAQSGSLGSANYQTTISDTPALQGATGGVMLPVYWWGERAANMDGLLGYPIDWWQMVTSAYSVPAMGDFIPGYDPADVVGTDPVRSNWLVAFGSGFVRPWRNAGVTLERL